MQKDTLDVQARDSLPLMLQCVQAGLSEDLNGQVDEEKIRFAIGRLQVWDHRHEAGSVSAAVFEAWEFQIFSYMHSLKIEDVRLRQSISSLPES